MKTTLRKLIEAEMYYTHEKMDDITFHTFDDEELDIEKESFSPFYAWTIRRVYFLVNVSGYDFVSSVPRYWNKDSENGPSDTLQGIVGKVYGKGC